MRYNLNASGTDWCASQNTFTDNLCCLTKFRAYAHKILLRISENWVPQVRSMGWWVVTRVGFEPASLDKLITESYRSSASPIKILKLISQLFLVKKNSSLVNK